MCENKTVVSQLYCFPVNPSSELGKIFVWGFIDK